MTTNPTNPAVLRQIVARASMPFERLKEPLMSAVGPEDEALIQSRLDEWARALSSDGTRGNLERFLAWQGLDLADARRAVGPVCLPGDAPLPAWAELLGEVLALDLTGLEDPASWLDPDKPIPFEDLLVPFAHVFRQRLEAQASVGQDRLADEARTQLAHRLLARLADAAAPVFYAEFQVSRTTGMGPLASLLPPGSDSLYRDFVRRMQAGELGAFFQKYPVLARRLAILTCLWTESHVEFLQRLSADWAEIAHMFGDGDALGPVTHLELGLSDPHRGGRGVIALTFRSGRRLVYKPKDLGTEVAYNRLLVWLNEHGASLDMKALQVLNRGTHGWVEFAGHEPCADGAAVARYYRRAGALLCLIYVLEGTDCHGENLVASGETPVLIDNETLMHHRVRLGDLGDLHGSAQFLAYEQLEHSVLRTGLLPGWQMGKEGEVAYDVSGLGGYADQALPYRQSRWTHVNTDRMTLTFELGTLPLQSNIPYLNGVPVRLDEHVDAIVGGFAAMYRFFLAHREEILAPGGPLAAFKGQTVRFVFRGTRVYGLILKQISVPRYLRDGADYGIALEMLARAYLLTEEKPPYWSILLSERRAMQLWDIPFFTARTDDDTLVLELGDGGRGDEIQSFFAGPSFLLVSERLRGLDEADLSQQSRLIQVALQARVADGRRQALPEARREPLPDVVLLEPGAFIAQAVDLATGLSERAIQGADGSVTWIAPLYLTQAERFQLGHLDLNLYDGLSGIALFLAALEYVGADTGIGHRELCLAALQFARKELRENIPDRQLHWLRIGGAVGLGSMMYTLTRIAQFLGDSALLDEAVAAARLLTPDLIAEDRALDVIGGAAGAILGLLAVYEASQDAVVLARAVDCGRHLLAVRVASEAGPRAWATIGGRLLTGFSHGAAGIAYALLRLASHAAVVSPAVADAMAAAAKEAIDYEASVFVESEGNWPDLRPPLDTIEPDAITPKFSLAWCHGAPGIGLARLGGLPVLDTPAIRRDVEVALATTQRALAYQHHDADHVCCGNMGRIEVLLVAGERLGRPDLVEEAHRQASQVVVRAEQSGGYRYASLLPRGVHVPGFFQGAAGIGYELLRLAYPDRLPSVLLWA